MIGEDGKPHAARCSGFPGTNPRFSFWVRKGSSRNTAVYFEGGGACWDNTTCSLPIAGLIGTLIGLVAMMGNMSDPQLVAKGMATALLGTLYGAIVANTFFGPMAGKLKNNTAREVAYCEVAIEALRGIARSETPRNITDKLVARLPGPQREAILAAA